MLKFTAVMLPYVMLVCGGSISLGDPPGSSALRPAGLHADHPQRSATSPSCSAARWILGLHGRDPLKPARRRSSGTLALWLAVDGSDCGRASDRDSSTGAETNRLSLRPRVKIWTPAVRKMLLLSIPVALGAGVLQLSVLLDKGISYALMQGVDAAGNHIVTLPFLRPSSCAIRWNSAPPAGSTSRSFCTNFPLGVFAIALATAIFPKSLRRCTRSRPRNFKRVLRTGHRSHALGRLSREHRPDSRRRAGDAPARSSTARSRLTTPRLIAALDAILRRRDLGFSLLQIINRAYYAVHDTVTPLVMSIVNIVANLIVEIPAALVARRSGHGRRDAGQLFHPGGRDALACSTAASADSGCSDDAHCRSAKMVIATIVMDRLLIASSTHRSTRAGVGRGLVGLRSWD